MRLLLLLVLLSAAPLCAGKTADFNDDCVVNFADLSLFRGGFGSTDPTYDLNADGRVNFGDLALFRSAFGSNVCGEALLSWDAPTQNEDGTPLTDLAGYKVYMSYDTPGPLWVLSTDTLATSVVVGDLSVGTWYFAVIAVDEVGNESAFSNVAGKAIL